MSTNNNLHHSFRKAADELRSTPSDSSWNRLETLLDNQELKQENKSYRRQLRWISGIAASFLVLGLFVYTNGSDDAMSNNQKIAYNLESLQETAKNNILYDIDKLSILNDKYN